MVESAAHSRTVTVASVPASHPYVRGISGAPGIIVLDDPPVPGEPVGTWWPPAVLDPAWIRAHRNDADLLHLHFGTESFPPGHLTACIDAAHEVGWPVVFTVHDLEHPQATDQALYLAQLDELIPAVDAVITLTHGAAREIRERWGRDAEVIPHPSLFPVDAPAPAVLPSDDLRVGVFLKDLRPNVDAPGTVAAALDAVAALRARDVPAVAEIRMHHAVRDAAAADAVRRLCAASDHAQLIEHERLTDAQLAISLARLDACVLPYRHGTHSGWLELCWDLGVPVVAPDLGHYAEQHPDGSVVTWHPGDPASLTAALDDLLTPRTAARSGSRRRAQRVIDRRSIRQTTDLAAAAQHARLYRELLEERTA